MKISKILTIVVITGAVMMTTLLVNPATAQDNSPVVVGFIGSFASDTGRSTLRGAEIAIEELNAKGGCSGRPKDKAGHGRHPRGRDRRHQGLRVPG